MFKVNVSPDMAMYHLLRSQGYDPAYALAEFIDNALHAYQEKCKSRIRGGVPLKVDIKFYSPGFPDGELRNSITIEDDGPGIGRDQLPHALKPARHKESKWLSEFGIGMKAAAVWFADTWELRTRPTGDKTAFKLTFDLEALLASGGDTLEVNEDAPEKAERGTKITLKKLRRKVDDKKYSEICEMLRELYQRFTVGTSPTMDLTAWFDGTPQSLKFVPSARLVLCSPVHKAYGKQVYAIGPERTWSVAISMVFNGVPVEGQICLLEKGSYTNNPGLVFFRHDRVICGTVKRPNMPRSMFGTSNKYAPQRVYGELHLDGLPVSYTKDKFEIDEAAFFEQLKRNPEVEQLIAQAENFRAKGHVICVNSEAEIGAKNGKPAEPEKGSSSTQATAPESAEDGADDTFPQNGNQPPSQDESSHPATVSTPPTTQDDQPHKQTSSETAKPTPKPAQQRPLVILLEQIKPKARSLALRSIVDETLYQCRARRDTGAGLCMRLVLELGLMTRIELDFPSEYSKVSEKGVAALLNYIHSNSTAFFDKRADHKVIKCVQSLFAGTQADVVLLNNVAHGHYQPSKEELDLLAKNLEPLIRWAYA